MERLQGSTSNEAITGPEAGVLMRNEMRENAPAQIAQKVLIYRVRRNSRIKLITNPSIWSRILQYVS
jgi:hypothetical protein